MYTSGKCLTEFRDKSNEVTHILYNFGGLTKATVVLGVCTKYKLISLSKVPDFVPLKDFAYSFFQTLPWKPMYHHSCEFSCLLPVNDIQSNKTKAFNEAVHFAYRCNCPCLCRVSSFHLSLKHTMEFMEFKFIEWRFGRFKYSGVSLKETIEIPLN